VHAGTVCELMISHPCPAVGGCGAAALLPPLPQVLAARSTDRLMGQPCRFPPCCCCRYTLGINLVGLAPDGGSPPPCRAAIPTIQAGEERYWDLMRLQRIADKNNTWANPVPRCESAPKLPACQLADQPQPDPASVCQVCRASPRSRSYWAQVHCVALIPHPPPPPPTHTPAAAAPAAAPTVWNYTQCMEIDTQYWWNGAPWDMVSRSYVAQTMNKAFATQKYRKEDVIAVSAYEGIGLGQVLAGWLPCGDVPPCSRARTHDERRHAACGSCGTTVGCALWSTMVHASHMHMHAPCLPAGHAKLLHSDWPPHPLHDGARHERLQPPGDLWEPGARSEPWGQPPPSRGRGRGLPALSAA
jgi:hypothetical protein